MHFSVNPRSLKYLDVVFARYSIHSHLAFGAAEQLPDCWIQQLRVVHRCKLDNEGLGLKPGHKL